jgi:uncharacterized protein YjbJ (UPF0337 family)
MQYMGYRPHMSATSKSAGSNARKRGYSMRSSTKDSIEGAARTAAGIIKEETGKALGNVDLQEEGDADQFVGNAQQSIGKIKKALGS